MVGVAALLQPATRPQLVPPATLPQRLTTQIVPAYSLPQRLLRVLCGPPGQVAAVVVPLAGLARGLVVQSAETPSRAFREGALPTARACYIVKPAAARAETWSHEW
eukprot:2327267-Prorocentrum_lima.AAC.1